MHTCPRNLQEGSGVRLGWSIKLTVKRSQGLEQAAQDSFWFELRGVTELRSLELRLARADQDM